MACTDDIDTETLSDSSESDSFFDTKTIIAIVVGAVGGLLLIAFVGYLAYNCSKSRSDTDNFLEMKPSDVQSNPVHNKLVNF
jgi:hypothetical protein